MPHQTFWDRSSGRYINFSSAGELWNRAPDEKYFYQNGQEIVSSCFAEWIQLSNSGSLPRPSICGSSTAEIIYSSYYGYPGNIQKSSDFGETWEDLNAPNSDFVHRIICSSDGSVVFFYGEANGDTFVFYLSTDYGETWNLVYEINPVYGGWACGIWMSPTGDKLLISAGYDIGIIKSEDMGNTWTQLSSIQSSPTWGYNIKATPNTSTIVAIGSENSSSANTIIISKDFGVTWNNTIVDPTPEFTVGRIIALSEDGSCILVFKVSDNSQKEFICKVSNDGGITWVSSGPIPETTEETSYLYTVKDVTYTSDLSLIIISLYASEFWISRDFGYTWEIKSNPSYFNDEYQETQTITLDQLLLSNNKIKLFATEYNGYVYKTQCLVN